MCKIIANNIAKNDTITVAISGSNLVVLQQICLTMCYKIHNEFATFSNQISEADHIFQTNKLMMLTAIDSMAKHIKRLIDKHTENCTLYSRTLKKIKFTSVQLLAFYQFDFYYYNGFNQETNILFYPLIHFISSRQIVLKQVEFETIPTTVDIGAAPMLRIGKLELDTKTLQIENKTQLNTAIPDF